MTKATMSWWCTCRRSSPSARWMRSESHWNYTTWILMVTSFLWLVKTISKRPTCLSITDSSSALMSTRLERRLTWPAVQPLIPWIDHRPWWTNHSTRSKMAPSPVEAMDSLVLSARASKPSSITFTRFQLANLCENLFCKDSSLRLLWADKDIQNMQMLLVDSHLLEWVTTSSSFNSKSS